MGRFKNPLRSPSEIAYRLRQEAANLWSLYVPLATSPDPSPLPLPRPDEFLTEDTRNRLSRTGYQQQIVSVAEAALAHEFPLLGYTVETGPEIRWQKDYIHGKEAGPQYFRRVPYLDSSVVGDHKIIWELNRHQHLLALVQADLLTGRTEFLREVWEQLDSWLQQNPMCRGMNWASALEVAFRALSWCWIEHWAGTRMPRDLRCRFLDALFAHGRYLENNLSIYFSPNTHLQGEALALHALGLLFSTHPAGLRWQATGHRILEEIIQTHVRNDGGHFEQSSYYHVYATDMFLLHALLCPVSDQYKAKLRQMAGYLDAIAGTAGEIPLLGDDDGGRLFHPYGNRRRFGRSTLATVDLLLDHQQYRTDPEDLAEVALWWFGERCWRASESAERQQQDSSLFADSGIAVLSTQDDLHLVADFRGFGTGGAGHSHAHALHFVLRRGAEDVLIDPGTYTYVGEPEWRNRFRGTTFHNTVTVGNHDQAEPAGPFRWRNLPSTQLLKHSSAPWFLHACCTCGDVRHHRLWSWTDSVLFVLDRVEVRGEPASVAQHWHAGGDVERIAPGVYRLPGHVQLLLTGAERTDEIEGWISPVPGQKEKRPVIRAESTTPQGGAPLLFGAAFLCDTDDEAAPARFSLQARPDGVILELDTGQRCEFPFSQAPAGGKHR